MTDEGLTVPWPHHSAGDEVFRDSAQGLYKLTDGKWHPMGSEVSADHPFPCDWCGKRGRVRGRGRHWHHVSCWLKWRWSWYRTRRNLCKGCNGEGAIENYTCRVCGGSGEARNV